MAYALSLRSDHQSSAKLKTLWSECSKLESEPSMVNLGYPPHITYAIYDEIDPKVLTDAFDTIFGGVRRTTIIFDKLDMFESPDAIVLWANPILSQEIFSIHDRIHSLIDVELCRGHYQPNIWIPHCSLATAIPSHQRAFALKMVNQPIAPFEVVFDVVDCVSFLPVQVLQEKHLVHDV